MRIGAIDFPALGEFNIGETTRKIEHIAYIGSKAYLPAEFDPSLPTVDFSGHIYKVYQDSRTLTERENDVNALDVLRSSYNFCYNVRGHSGYLAVDKVRVSPNSGVLWPFSGAGKWYDSSRYTLVFDCVPVQMSTGASIQAGNNWIAVPIGATYSGGDGVTTTKTGEDGVVTFVRSNSSNVRFDLTTNDYHNGEVRCYDGTSQCYYEGHLFTGNVTVTNSFYKVVVSSNTISVYYWNTDQYIKIDDFVAGSFSRWWLTECNGDKAVVKTSSGIIITVERGRVPYIYSPSTLTCTALTPSNQSTSTVDGYCVNYLTLGTNLYVSGNTNFSISSNVISAGHHWIFYDNSPAQLAKDCLMLSNIRRQVVER